MRGESAAVGYHMHGFSAWHAHACTLSAVVRHCVRCACTASVVWLTMHARYWWHQLLSPNACAVSASVKHCMHGIGSCHTLHVLYQPCQTLHVPYLFRISRCYIRNARHHLVVEECMRGNRVHQLRSPTAYAMSIVVKHYTHELLSHTMHARHHFVVTYSLHAWYQLLFDTARAVSISVEHCMRGISCCHTRHVRYQVVSRIARAVSGANRQCSRINR